MRTRSIPSHSRSSVRSSHLTFPVTATLILRRIPPMPFLRTPFRQKVTFTLPTAQFNAMMAHVQRRGGTIADYIRELVAADQAAGFEDIKTIVARAHEPRDPEPEVRP